MREKILILVIGITVVFTSFASAYNLEEYYPLAQGNRWTYSVIEDEESHFETVKKIEGKEIVNNVETQKMIYAEDEYECVTFDSEGLKEYKDFDDDEYEIFEPPKIIFPNNMKTGETKEYSINSVKYNLDGAKIGETKEIGQISLESIEEIEVPAGKFSNCLKFSFIAEYKEADGNYSKEDCSFWLAPVVGKVKEFCIYTEYDIESKKENNFIKRYELISAVVDGKQIGNQELTTR